MLYVDIPTLPELRTLAAARGDICASLFLPTTPLDAGRPPPTGSRSRTWCSA